MKNYIFFKLKNFIKKLKNYVPFAPPYYLKNLKKSYVPFAPPYNLRTVTT